MGYILGKDKYKYKLKGKKTLFFNRILSKLFTKKKAGVFE